MNDDVEVFKICFYIKCENLVEGELFVLLKLVYINKCLILVFVKVFLFENVVCLGIDCEFCL